MITQFENLSNEEYGRLLTAPVLVSVLVACTSNQEMDKKEKAEAIKLTHLKTFTSTSLLQPYYEKVEEDFEKNFEAAVTKYAPFKAGRCEELKKEINEVNAIIDKLSSGFANDLRQSLSDYTEHVRKAERSVVEDFIFPFKVRGLTD
jgi:ribosomal protein S17E